MNTPVSTGVSFSFVYLRMLVERSAIKELLHAITVLTDMVGDKPLSEEENTRLKYVAKVINSSKDMIAETNSPKQYALLDDTKEVGTLQIFPIEGQYKLELTEMINGCFTITPIHYKSKLIALSLNKIGE